MIAEGAKALTALVVGGDLDNAAFRAMVEALPVAIYTTDADGHLTYFNAAAEKLAGRKPELGTDKWCVTWKVFLPDGTFLPRDQSPMAAALQGAEVPTGIEAIAERPDGTRLWFTPCPGVVRDAAGRITGAINLLMDITDRKKAEIQANEQFRVMVETTPECVKIVAPDGTLLFMNPPGLAMVEASSAEAVTGKNVYDLVAAEDRVRFREFNERICRGEKGSLEFDIVGLEGTRRHVETHAAPFRHIDGSTVHLAITHDITKRKQAEAAALLLSAIVDSSDDAIISKDLEGIITSWNKSAERMFGHTDAEAIGQSVAALLIPPDRLDEEPKILARLRGGERVDHFETVRRRKDGTLLDISLTISPVRNAEGNIIGASKIARDISEHKRIQAREQQARATAELLNQIGPTLLSQLDGNPLVQSVTEIATELVGAEFGSFFYNVIDDKGEAYMLYTLSGVPREAFANFPMPRNTAVFSPTFKGEGVVRSDDITLDSRYGKNSPHFGMPKGHLPVRSYLAVPVVSRSGEVLGGLFFGHSMPGKFTDLHSALITGVAAQAAIAMDNARLFEQASWAQRELKRSNEDLRRANRDLETFAYSASHDLQEPLRNVAINAQLLQRCSSGFDDDQAQCLDSILQGARRMEALIRDLLAYTRAIKVGDEPPRPVAIDQVFHEVLEILKKRVEENSAQVTASDLPVMPVHEVHMSQLLQNLIGNALKYRGVEAPRVHISAVQQDGWWLFTVTDNGIGIESKHADQIFELFKRLHTRDEYPGSGVGLAICTRIVEQYGGRIWLERSTPGAGSTFCFSLPDRRGN